MAEYRPKITPAQYEALITPPPCVPTQRQLFERQLAFWVKTEMATENELRSLMQFIPGKGIFLVVPRRPEPIDYNKLMRLVIVSGNTGISERSRKFLSDQITIPRDAYMMLGIEDGRKFLNMSAYASEKEIIKEGRSPYVTYEGTVYAATFPVLAHHEIYCCGSRMCNDTPLVCRRGEMAILSSVWGVIDYPSRGAPSCRERKKL